MITITEENFKELVYDSEKPVLVDFWAEWCMPCKMFTPVVEEVEGELSDSITFGKFNVDGSITIPRQYKVMSIPTIILFKGEEVIKKHTGSMQKDDLIAWLKDEV